MRKREKKENRRGINDRIADSFEGSKEVFLDVPKLTLIGNKEVSIENYKGICEYTESQLIIETKPCRICLEGDALEVRTISDEQIYIAGSISQIRFIKEE